MTPAKSLVAVAIVSAIGLGLSWKSPGQKPAAGEKAAPSGDKAAAAGAASPVAPGVYSIDAGHSSVLFRAKHMGVSWFYGAFKDVSGTVTVDAKPEKCKVIVEIETESVDSRNEKRDGHLKSPDFLDAKQFPTASFTSKSVKKSGPGKYAVTGDFSLHGVTKSVTLDMEETGFGETSRGVLAGWHGVLTIRRVDYGIKYRPEELSDEVQLTLSIEAVQTDAAGK